MKTISLNYFGVAVLLLVVAITTITFAASPTSRTDTGNAHPSPGRFVVSTEIGTEPVLLDTSTGDMWTLKESTNLVDARLQAWVPMERLNHADEFEQWQLRAKDKYDTFMESMKKQTLSDERDSEE